MIILFLAVVFALSTSTALLSVAFVVICLIIGDMSMVPNTLALAVVAGLIAFLSGLNLMVML